MNLNTLEKDDLLRVIASQNERLKRLEAIFQGQPIPSARITNLNLGGLNNQSGILRVFDEAGVQKVLIDKDGIVIQDGLLTFLNSAGDPILDSEGIVSSNSFPSDQVINSTGYTTTSTSLVDVTGSTLDPFVLTRDTKVLVTVQAQLRNDNFVDDGSFAELQCIDSLEGGLITFDAAALSYITGFSYSGGFISGIDYQHAYPFFSISAIFDLAAGSHELKLRYRVDGTGTARIGTYILSYIILGS